MHFALATTTHTPTLISFQQSEIMNAKLRLHSRGKLSLRNTFVKWLSWSCRRWAGSSWGRPSAPCRPSSRWPTWAAGPPRRRTTPPRSGRPSPTAGSSWTADPADPPREPVEDHNWLCIRALNIKHFDIINLIWFDRFNESLSSYGHTPLPQRGTSTGFNPM